MPLDKLPLAKRELTSSKTGAGRFKLSGESAGGVRLYRHAGSLWQALTLVPDGRREAGRRYPLASLLLIAVAAMLSGRRDQLGIARWGRRLSREALAAATLDQFVACWKELKDPRTGDAGLHDFHDLLMIGLCTVLCGSQDAVDMALFAAAKQPVLRGFLKLKHGAPSHDTFNRLFRFLDPTQVRAAFQQFMVSFSERLQGVVTIDGKLLRRSFDRATGKSPLHMVSVWACEQRLIPGQIATDAKSNEITAVPKLLERLSLNGTIVTVDALNCQRDIAQQIVARGGAYVLALRGNQARGMTRGPVSRRSGE